MQDKALKIGILGCAGLGKSTIANIVSKELNIPLQDKELLEQAADKLKAVTGLKAELEKAESSAAGKWTPVVVGSVQTLMREKRLQRFKPDFFGAIIIDEAHRGYVLDKEMDDAELLYRDQRDYQSKYRSVSS